MTQRTHGVDLLIACYRQGVFPMADSRDDAEVHLVDPEHRGVIPLDAPHIPRRLARRVRQDPFEVRIDTRFRDVVSACAEAGYGRENTWISLDLESLYQDLFLAGFAHSVECWRGSELLGGLYGVAIGGAFFGESMFSRATDASKVALVHLLARLKVGGFVLLDTQFLTAHLERLGAIEIPRREYRRRLAAALLRTGDYFRLAPYPTGAAVLQAISQRS
jgi:leucyl/phenylalanyl-tRNA--protein transferase